MISGIKSKCPLCELFKDEDLINGCQGCPIAKKDKKCYETGSLYSTWNTNTAEAKRAKAVAKDAALAILEIIKEWEVEDGE